MSNDTATHVEKFGTNGTVAVIDSEDGNVVAVVKKVAYNRAKYRWVATSGGVETFSKPTRKAAVEAAQHRYGELVRQQTTTLEDSDESTAVPVTIDHPVFGLIEVELHIPLGEDAAVTLATDLLENEVNL